MYTYMHAHTYIYAFLPTYIHICINACTDACIHIQTYVCLSIYILTPIQYYSIYIIPIHKYSITCHTWTPPMYMAICPWLTMGPCKRDFNCNTFHTLNLILSICLSNLCLMFYLHSDVTDDIRALTDVPFRDVCQP